MKTLQRNKFRFHYGGRRGSVGAVIIAETTASGVAEMIDAAGLDSRCINCAIIAKRINIDRAHGNQEPVWETIAGFARRNIPDALYHRAWDLAGVPKPYTDAA